ncbi:restriction endonuclease [Legionella pneumophila]|uniref:restriction endonuclease n=1 Tax=Legionella pneumophila TaxID=446 RepID=UPI0010218AF6|nr:restriction endonuclease [Legionella pneumophila]RYW81488.1 restriction endonuclease [Legionella pneumophila]HBD7349818.1 restriction endonuclease [Legionella pneumophila]HCJ4316665.1 restriction endonuclease [Legionella pneumophila]HDZ4927674.1 restriction endonuclease [Legionella pneumophila]
MKIYSFDTLANADLIIDAVYEGGSSGNTSDDPISKIIKGIGNMGGFRSAGQGIFKKLIVLYTNMEDGDWPDSIDTSKGQFIYYGDNKHPGHDIHDTPRQGNATLKMLFDSTHNEKDARRIVPPIFIFVKYPTASSSRSVQFKGVAVPGYPGLSATDDLIAVWKTTNGQRFQNYRAIFTILNIPMVSRKWINSLFDPFGQDNSLNPFYQWKISGKADVLIAPSTKTIRTQIEQMPRTKLEREILQAVFDYFCEAPIKFEACAAKIFQLYDENVLIDEITRSAVDGGKDAIGRYVLGIKEDPVYAEFFLEAKCYQPGLNGQNINSVGVKEVSRLISRIKNRQFGVLVTTSFIAKQAYGEVREDGHPIVFLSGGDISRILIKKGINSTDAVLAWLNSEFSKS